MQTEIKVGPPVITINQGSTFMVTDDSGEIDPTKELGVFAKDTRLISSYRFTINGAKWVLLSSSQVSYFSALLHFTNPRLTTPEGVIDERQLGLTVTRTVGDGIHEDFDIVNHSLAPVRIFFELDVQSDFADIFDVKSHSLTRRGTITSRWVADGSAHQLITTYRNRDFERGVVYELLNSTTPPAFANGQLVFDLRLEPGETWHTCGYIIPVYDGREHQPIYACHQVTAGNTTLDELQRRWHCAATVCTTSNDDVQHAFRQSVQDMGALRIYDEDFSEDVWLPAAGVPWFVTIFGRDSLIVSLQNMIVHYPFALGALEKLAMYQEEVMDDYRDAEPGKILHELRFGELAHFKLIPHTPYYGTADASILYLIALSEAYRWSGDRSLFQKYLPVAERCLAWIDTYGDLDGDGWQEYKTRSSLGYHNVGWKDSGNAVLYPDGRIVDLPIGLCELQGYVYDAKVRMAEFFHVMGEAERARQLREEAAALRQRINEVFWMPEEGFYALALDPAKEPVRSIASNAGHLLWSGVADHEQAERMVRRLLEPAMFSGWGIRTLSAEHPGYNPFDYQVGSVWPHDNGIIAAGMKRYGFADEANLVARAIFDAASMFESYRLPELFAGLQRQAGSFPVQYLGANIPQAWAAGSVFHFVQTILGLRADAPAGKLYVNPTLPTWLPDIELANLKVGTATLHLRFKQDGAEPRCEILDQRGAIEVVHEPAPFWRVGWDGSAAA